MLWLSYLLEMVCKRKMLVRDRLGPDPVSMLHCVRPGGRSEVQDKPEQDVFALSVLRCEVGHRNTPRTGTLGLLPCTLLGQTVDSFCGYPALILSYVPCICFFLVAQVLSPSEDRLVAAFKKTVVRADTLQGLIHDKFFEGIITQEPGA